MAKKGLDSSFLHYGIRKDDLRLIETICIEHKLDFNWVQEELLKEYHEKKIRDQYLEDKAIEKVIEKAISKIK